ncbi:MAG: AAA family ATPase, partial [Bacteroidota bacterium]
MKILQLRIHNLNSLRGQQEIDFSSTPLSDTGLFAIVGETGAGKTTILDAITLALYGRIDRDPDVRGAGKEVMSYGTANCSAEIEFTTTEGIYRSRWERRRARNKPDGRLQPAERTVSRLKSTTNQWEFLAEKSSEVDELIPTITGLDYNRFTRSVMLTQGEFARFLKAKPGDRATLLESITGTEVYRQLSTAAYEKHQLARQAFDELKDRMATLE